MPRLSPTVLATVFGGGVAGGLARYAVTESWPTSADGFPWATFGVNTAGAFALPLLLAVLACVAPHRYLRPLLATGFLGAFTTFSSVVVAADRLAARGQVGTAAGYLVGSTAAALAAGSAGLLLGRALAIPRLRRGPAARVPPSRPGSGR